MGDPNVLLFHRFQGNEESIVMLSHLHAQAMTNSVKAPMLWVNLGSTATREQVHLSQTFGSCPGLVRLFLIGIGIISKKFGAGGIGSFFSFR